MLERMQEKLKNYKNNMERAESKKILARPAPNSNILGNWRQSISLMLKDCSLVISNPL
jgi:hypothetical protein